MHSSYEAEVLGAVSFILDACDIISKPEEQVQRLCWASEGRHAEARPGATATGSKASRKVGERYRWHFGDY